MQAREFQAGDTVSYRGEEWFVAEGPTNGYGGSSYRLSKTPPPISAPENELKLVWKRPPQTDEELGWYKDQRCTGRVFLPNLHEQTISFEGTFRLSDDRKTFKVFNGSMVQPLSNEPPYLVENIVRIRLLQ